MESKFCEKRYCFIGDMTTWHCNFVFPDSWIIEEELRRERKKKKRERPIIRLPIHQPSEEEEPQTSPKPEDEGEERVIIIDI